MSELAHSTNFSLDDSTRLRYPPQISNSPSQDYLPVDITEEATNIKPMGANESEGSTQSLLHQSVTEINDSDSVFSKKAISAAASAVTMAIATGFRRPTQTLSKTGSLIVGLLRSWPFLSLSPALLRYLSCSASTTTAPFQGYRGIFRSIPSFLSSSPWPSPACCTPYVLPWARASGTGTIPVLMVLNEEHT